MVYETPGGDTFVFLYERESAQICCADEWYPCIRDALAVWDSIPHSAWNPVPDPLPGCQHDAADPVRIKGRQLGTPEWGKYEILLDGVWCEYAE